MGELTKKYRGWERETKKKRDWESLIDRHTLSNKNWAIGTMKNRGWERETKKERDWES